MIDELLEKVEENGPDRLNLFFITRTLKDGVKSKGKKVLEKYKFTVYSVDIDKEIKEHLFKLTCDQFKYIIKKELETSEYDVITDDIPQIFTYSMTNKAMSFADVVNSQLINKSQIKKIKDLTSLVEKEELWAYCVGFFDDNDDWFYTFRKILKGKVVVEDDEKTKSKVRFFRAKFDTVSNKLEMLHGETINLDEKIDCIYYEEIFYIIQKTQFEQITCIAEEFKERAEHVVKELEQTGLIVGLDLLSKQVEDKPAIHKKLVRLQKTNNYQHLKITDITKMLEIAEKFGGKLKQDKDGKLMIQTEQDIELAIKVLADFYKKGEFSGKPYGTFSGKQLKENE
ncbi:MAG: Kiwa anti-phage protein KwaB-like domain-containing protein [Paludibacter sp.]